MRTMIGKRQASLAFSLVLPAGVSDTTQFINFMAIVVEMHVITVSREPNTS